MMVIFLRLYLLLGLSTMLSTHEEHRVSNVPNTIQLLFVYNCHFSVYIFTLIFTQF